MKRELQNKILIILISIQSILYVFVKLRIIVILTLIITCLFYSNGKRKVKMLAGVIIYCLLVFLLFSVYYRILKPFKFLGISDKYSVITDDLYAHDLDTFYFAILPNTFSHVKLDAYKQTYSFNLDYIKMKQQLSSMLNLRTSKTFDTSYMITLNKKLIYIGDIFLVTESNNKISTRTNEEILKKKLTLLNNSNIETDDCIFFSIRISESDDFWGKYKETKRELEKLQCIYSIICYPTKFINANFDFAIFFADESMGFVKFKQKNDIKIKI